MSNRVIIPPTVEPITLAQAREQMGDLVGDTINDPLIIRRITEARQFAENYMQRAIVQQTRELRLDAFCDGIDLDFPNLQSVVSVKYIDTDGAEQTMDAADYEVDTYGYIGSVYPAYGKSWPTARAQKNAVRIQYKCGYGISAVEQAKAITGATQATPGVFTSAAHGFADDDILLHSAVAGMVEVDGNIYRKLAGVEVDSWQLANLKNTTGLSTATFGAYQVGMTAQKVELKVPDLLVEAMLIILGNWTNFQGQAQNGLTVSRVPFAARDILDTYRLYKV